MSISPTAEGFRAAFRWPSLAFSEIAWRWIVSGTAIALFFFGLFEYLSTLPVTNADLMLLRTRHPYLVAQAFSHILHGTLVRVVMSGLLAVLLLSLLWMVAATFGRIATVRRLLEYFRARFHGERDAASNLTTNTFPAILRLNFLRLVLAIAALVGFAGSGIVASFVSPESHPRPGLAFLLFLPLLALVCLVWWLLNWLLSLAALFAVRDCCDAAGAISAAVRFCREHLGAVAAVTTWSELGHLMILSIGSTAIAVPMGFAGLLPWQVIVAGMALVALVYLAIVDWLYMARLAGYVCLAEVPEELLKPVTYALSPAAPTIHTSIDRDELILSDVPGLT
ncbi:MAG TPA: hypothetical protein VHW45_09780 [Candidatus Sulfotelmatobacter sp.]|nr:hypothetical protein [Candidatus Sulfotelmatobacter sp.]